MHRNILLLLLLFTQFSYAAEDQFNLKKINAIEDIQLTATADYLIELIEESMALRGELLQFISEYEKEKEPVLTGKQIESLLNNFNHQLELRQKFFKFIDTYKNRCFDEEHLIFGKPQIVKGGLLSMSASTTLFDNFAICWSVVNNNSKLRRLLNKGDQGVHLDENAFADIVKSFHSTTNRKNMRAALDWLKKNDETLNSLLKTDKQITFLNNILAQSPSLQDLKDGFEFGDYLKFVDVIGKDSRDSVASLGENSVGTISKIFGNGIGVVQTRNGLLFKDEENKKIIRQALKPFDIILEKTPFRLTDKFIPGHFGHVAIYLGNQEELTKLGLWDAPIIKPHQEAIKEGKCILEALRDGVQLSTYDKFMNVDDMAVLRVKNFDTEKVLTRAVGQIGKEYDFNFDVQTIDKIVCSELVYQVFTDIQWETAKNLGRYTISPDHVAKRRDENLISLVIFYHQGKQSTPEIYNSLIK